MDSEPGFTWALVQSFSLENTDIFRGKRFGINLPLNFHSRNSMSVESSSSGNGVDRTMQGEGGGGGGGGGKLLPIHSLK